MKDQDRAAFPCPLLKGDEAGLLLDWCARTLPRNQAEALEQHMEICPECRELAAQQRMVWEALDAWEVDPPDPGFRRRLYDRIEADRPSLLERMEAWMAGVRWKPAIPVALAGIVLVLVLDQPASLPVDPTGFAVSADQVELALNDLQLLEELQLPVK